MKSIMLGINTQANSEVIEWELLFEINVNPHKCVVLFLTRRVFACPDFVRDLDSLFV